jgi:hypothetical protein
MRSHPQHGRASPTNGTILADVVADRIARDDRWLSVLQNGLLIPIPTDQRHQ